MACRAPFRTADGYLCALIYNDKQWRAFFAALGEPQRYDADPRLANISVRTNHMAALNAMLGECFATRTTAEWLALLEAADIPAMPLHTLESLCADPHLAAVGALTRMEHPSEGSVRVPGPATQWSETPPTIRRPSPRLGEHSAELLAQLGYPAEEIARMAQAGVTTLADSTDALAD